MRTPLAFLLQSYFVSSVLCFSSMRQEPGRRAPLLHSAHSPVNMHTPATVTGVTPTELSTLTSTLRLAHHGHLQAPMPSVLTRQRPWGMAGSGSSSSSRRLCRCRARAGARFPADSIPSQQSPASQHGGEPSADEKALCAVMIAVTWPGCSQLFTKALCKLMI